MIMVQENTALKNITYEWQKKMKTRPIFFLQSLLSLLVRVATSMCWMKSRRKAFGKKASVWADAPWRSKQEHQIYRSPFTKRSVERHQKMCRYEYLNSRLASKKKPVLHKQYGCGGTSIRRHGKEDAQVTERRRGLPCCCWKMWSWVPLCLRIASHG